MCTWVHMHKSYEVIFDEFHSEPVFFQPPPQTFLGTYKVTYVYLLSEMLIYLSKQRKFATNLPVFPFIFMFFGNADMAVAAPKRGHAFIADQERSIAKSRQIVRHPGGDFAYERGGDVRRLAQGCKFRILVSLRVFWQNAIIFSGERLVQGCTRKDIEIYIYRSQEPSQVIGS